MVLHILSFGAEIMIGNLVKLQFESFVHPNVRGMIGIVMSRPNGHGQYEVFVIGYKTLYLLRGMFEVICENR